MPETAVPTRRRRAIVVGVLLAAAIVVILLLLRHCHPAAVEDSGFDYFKAKAAELHNDPAKIIAYVRDEMPTLDYRANVKGALGALWNGAASVEEKKLLAEALLSAAGAGRTVSLDEIAPGRDKSQDNPPPLNLTIVHRVETKAEPKDTPIYDGPSGALVGDVHSVEILAGGKRRITLRAGAAATLEAAAPEDAEGEDLVFTWRVPGQAAKVPTLVSVRELWHRDNRTGARGANVGDRHEFVVIPCRIGPYVREKEQLLLKQRGREKSIEAPAYLGLLDYALASDDLLEGMEKQMKVTARRDQPRVLMLSRFVAPQLPGGLAYALDLRIDRVGFAGDRVAAYRAAQVRSFLESSLEQQFLEQFSGLPSSSTFDVFTMLKDDMADNVGRRLWQIRMTLRSLEQERSSANVATFTVRPGSQSKDTAVSKVQVRWTLQGFEIHGVPIRQDVASRLAQERDAVALAASGAGLFKDVDDAAVAVETDLLAADVTPPTSPGYTLLTSVDRARLSLAQPQTRFDLKWEEEKIPTEQQNRLLSVDGALAYHWRIQAGVFPVAGTRQVRPEALENATIHNPWYRAGDSKQANETSFVFSRKVYQLIKSGQSIPLTMQGRYGPKADVATTRPVEFAAPLVPVGPDTLSMNINGRPEKMEVFRCTFRGKPMAILDDPVFPVGLADTIQSVVTVIRCRLVDTHDVPICGAFVRVVDKAQAAPSEEEEGEAAGPTAPDGLFLLPPPDEADSYGKVALRVTFSDRSTQKVEVDLSSPGLSIVPVRVERPHAKLLYLNRNDRRQLEALSLSEEIKRQARRDLEAGRMVVIPVQYVTDGFRELTGYYACDSATGDYSGVTEDGLCGSTNWTQTIQENASQPGATTEDTTQQTPSAVETGSPRTYRNACIAWRVCCASRAGGIRQDEAIQQTLQAMKCWADATDIAGTFAAFTDDQLAGQLGALLKTGTINVNAAKPACQLGYLETTHYLARKIEGHDEK